MANAEHLEILKQGVEVWNKWREENEAVHPDLSGIKIDGIDFESIKQPNVLYVIGHIEILHERIYKYPKEKNRAYLKNKDKFELASINFSNVNLSNTYVARIDFSCSNFRSANLENSFFLDVTLSTSDFTGSYLQLSRFSNCFLNNVNFNEAELGNTVFGMSNLTGVQNMNNVYVRGGCTIDFQSLLTFNQIPTLFLQKIGLPENYINYLPDFFDDKPIRMHPAFLSHSWADKPFATKLYEALIARNVLVWYDERKLVPGDDIREGISKGIDLYDKFILVCSKNSLENSSWVDREIERAIIKEDRLFKERKQRIKTIIPIKIDDYVHNDWDSPKKHDIQRYVIGDFKDWQDDAKFEKSLDALVAALNADRGEDSVPSYL